MCPLTEQHITKPCTSCGKSYPLEAFVRSKTGRYGRGPKCLECRRAYRKAYKARRGEFVRQQDKAYYEAHREQRAAYQRANRESRRELKRASRARLQGTQSAESERERNRLLALKWHAENPEKSRENALAYRARRASAAGSFTLSEWRALCDFYGNRCLRCGSDGPLTVDHVIPLIRGGSNDISNIQPLCGPCNCAKGAKIIDYR